MTFITNSDSAFWNLSIAMLFSLHFCEKGLTIEELRSLFQSSFAGQNVGDFALI